MRREFNVAILPFWRYAVVSENNAHVGIPFYKWKSARKFFADTKEHLPWAGLYLIERRWWHIEIVLYYPGTPIC